MSTGPKNYPELKAGEIHSKLANHQTARISPLNIERLMLTPEGGDWRNWPEDYLLKCHKKLLASGKSAGYTDTYGRLRKRAPACTLTTKCTSISNGRFGHPTQHRALSVREAAALQTFDDDFKFEGTLGQTARQVGNAVPVLFAKALGQSIFEHKEQLQNG
ncbi:DNA cytosine methyltransferase [Terasakiella sp. A23]|uniref:DNA cytosine methyltransferase n=1 Tax=Terasakiella sp. FCG-A23 TaxID=3080561 RepID=UPI0029555B80|nr:DNA cytosine methyltransferase [Terasakiella sp. A23]MDV7341830.1 DNA cytosine methyltransferase [Terasakiella sp. A23]